MPRTLLLITFLTITATTKAQWTLQSTHTTADLRGIDNVGHGIAWASGTDGTILRTLDNGQHWQLCAKPPNGEHLDFRAIQAFDNNTAITMSAGKGDLSRLYKTTDGCQSWHLLFTSPDKDGFWDALQFAPSTTDRMAHPLAQSGVPGELARGGGEPKGGVSRVVARESDRRFGVLLGDPVAGHFVIFLTFDGGETWNADSANAVSAPNENAFAASNSLLIFQRRRRAAIFRDRRNSLRIAVTFAIQVDE